MEKRTGKGRDLPAEQPTQIPDTMWGYMNESYTMLPEWLEFWTEKYQMLEQMAEMKPQHITEDARHCYYEYVNAQMQYIYNYIYTGSIRDYSVYAGHLEAYRYSNPEGSKVFDKQKAYFEKLCKGGKHSNKQKKVVLRSDPKTSVNKNLLESSEKEPVPINDPIIDVEELRRTNWSIVKYPKANELLQQNVNVILIGHVDSGKTQLRSRILKNLKIENEQDAKRIGREQSECIFSTGSTHQAKNVECSKILFRLDKCRFTLFDPPGHRNYIPDMIVAACQSDVAVLVISAKLGEYESGFDEEGQIKEHAMLARDLGIHNLFCVVTKMDTIGWDQGRFNHIQTEVSAYLKDVCGYNNVKFIPIDSLRSINIDERGSNWYKDQSFFKTLENIEVPKKYPQSPLRIVLTDSFKGSGCIYVMGRLESGALIANQTVTLMPSNVYCIVKELLNVYDQQVPYALAGDMVKLSIKFVEKSAEINRGDIICNNLNRCQACFEFEATLHVLKLPDKKVLVAGTECTIHMHTAIYEAELTYVENPQPRRVVKPPFLRSGQTGTVRIKVNRELCLQKNEFMDRFGQFVLRDEGRNIACGKANKTILPEDKAQDNPNSNSKEREK